MERSIQTGALLVLAVIAMAAALYWLRPVMIPFVLALFISVGLSGFVELQMRWLRFPRPLAVLGTLLAGAIVLGLVGSLVFASVAELSSNRAEYQAKFDALTRDLLRAVPAGRLTMLSEEFASSAAGSVATVLVGTTNAIIGILSQSFLVLIFVVFLLLGGVGAGGPRNGIFVEAERRVRSYLVTKAAISGVTGILVGVTLGVLGVDLALVFGLFAFLLNFIPSVGSILATLLPLPIVLLDPELSTTAQVLALAIPGLVQVALGNFVEPKLMGGSLDLHPVMVLLALIFWGMLWGVAGALLATPMTAVMKIILARMEPTHAVAELMAGRLPMAEPAPSAPRPES